MAGLINKAKEMLHTSTTSSSTTHKEHDPATMTSTSSHTAMGSSTDTGPHSSGLMGRNDPTVDQSRDTGTTGVGTTGLGTTGQGLSGVGSTGTQLGSNTTGTHHHHAGGEHHHTTFAGAVLDPACDPKTAHVTGIDDGRTGINDGRTGINDGRTGINDGRTGVNDGRTDNLMSDTSASRVDSDRTYVKGGIDATKMPPSVVQEIIGEPVIEHGEPGYDRARRHSLKPADDLQRYGSGAQ